MTSLETKQKINIKSRGGVDNMKKFTSSRKGFTLIELLIVIVIVGILAGVVLSLINPQQQMRRARQTVFRSNAEKANMAYLACNASTQNASTCDTIAEIGFTDPGQPTTPAVPTYVIAPSPAAAGDTITLTSTYDTCVYATVVTPSTGVVASQFAFTKGANCLLE